MRLPIDAVLDELVARLDSAGRVVLQAPPGAGKTTRVPVELLRRGMPGRLLLLEPRRVAARAAAGRLAEALGERVGQRVGLTTRDERRRSADTRIEVVTDGVLLRRLQADPSLEGVGTILFDEFHERRVESELGLAFALETAEALRDDLRLLIASATLEAERVADLLGGAPVVRAQGREHPVEIVHRQRPRHGALAADVAAAVRDALGEAEGDVLVFLPGAREIDRVRRELAGTVGEARLLPLHGALPPAEQDAAVRPAAHRKIVLATDVAESSLTIEGVRVVVDAGLAREPRFDPATGLSGLVTVPVSQASAAQRAGRAGRTAPGRAVRLWTRADHAARPAQPRPALHTDDLAGVALSVADWGAELDELALLDPPPAEHWRAATALLGELGALDAAGRITSHGRALARLPVHPRLGQLLLDGAARGVGRLAAEVAAACSDRDPVRTDREHPCADVTVRVGLLRGERLPTGVRPRPGARQRLRREAQRLQRAVGDAGDVPASRRAPEVGRLIAVGWPDRVAAARPRRRGALLLAAGRGATVDERDLLADEPWLAVAALDRGEREARIHLAAPLTLDDLRAALADRVVHEREVAWRDGDVVAEERERLGALVLDRRPWGDAPDARRQAALLDGLREHGLELLRVDRAARELQARVALLRRELGEPWPRLDDETLLADADRVLGPFLLRARRRADLAALRLETVLRAQLPGDLAVRLEELAPTHLQVPSGSRLRLDYTRGQPTLAVRVQELFGSARTPRVVDGRVPVRLELLSPAQRPVQVTDDLAGFWERAYPQVRAELRGRYPKHAWPTDPGTAEPLRGTPRRR